MLFTFSVSFYFYIILLVSVQTRPYLNRVLINQLPLLLIKGDVFFTLLHVTYCFRFSFCLYFYCTCFYVLQRVHTLILVSARIKIDWMLPLRTSTKLFTSVCYSSFTCKHTSTDIFSMQRNIIVNFTCQLFHLLLTNNSVFSFIYYALFKYTVKSFLMSTIVRSRECESAVA